MDITTIFFDFDGVVADTEPLYDIFWRQVAEKYHIGIPDFPAKIKGTTLILANPPAVQDRADPAGPGAGPDP